MRSCIKMPAIIKSLSLVRRLRARGWPKRRVPVGQRKPAVLVPDSEGVALVLGLLAMVAWGSWANLLKLNAGHTRFEFFFLDYPAGPVRRGALPAPRHCGFLHGLDRTARAGRYGRRAG